MFGDILKLEQLKNLNKEKIMKNSTEQKTKLMNILRIATLGLVLIYFVLNSMYPLSILQKGGMLVVLFGLLIYRSYLQYQITNNRTPLLLMILAVVASVIVAVYFSVMN